MLKARAPFLFALAPLAALGLAIAPGCSNDTPATPQAAVSFSVFPGVNGASCPVGSAQVWNLGDTPVKDGDSLSGAGVHVTCSVKGAGGGYDVAGDVELQGKGSFTVSGHFDGSNNPQPNIRGTFVLAQGLGSWAENDCTVTFPDGANMGIAPGRVWAQIDCQHAVDSSRGTTCEASVQFRLENCAQ